MDQVLAIVVAAQANLPMSRFTVLQNDKRVIFQTASMAEKALGYLHGLQPEGQTFAPYSEEELPKAA